MFLTLILEALNIEGEKSDVERFEFPWSRYELLGENVRNGDVMEKDLSDPASEPSKPNGDGEIVSEPMFIWKCIKDLLIF